MEKRNWDYRYTWIRDASFTVYAFMRLGYTKEATSFIRWFGGRAATCPSRPITKNPVWHRRPRGTARKPPPPLRLPRVAPVRIGNLAYAQVQLDIFGELMDAVYLVNKYGEAISHEGWKHTVGK